VPIGSRRRLPRAFFQRWLLIRIPGVKVSRRTLIVYVVAAVILVAGFLIFPRATDIPDEDTAIAPAPADPQVDASPAAAVDDGSIGLDDLGAPDDPLPAPLPSLSSGEPVLNDHGADELARRILEGGPDFLPALIAALQASGIGIVGPGNVEVTRPAEPWQAMVMQRWEVRLAAATVLPERSVTLSLTDVAAFLIEVLPALKGAPVEQLIVDDLRAIAESPVPTKRFFGRFLAALGRNATSHTPYDLLGTVDPQTIRLNGLQASLILRRLAADIGIRASGMNAASPKETASLIDRLGNLIATTVHAQGRTACALSETTQTVLDAVAFGSSMAWGGFQVGELGMGGLMERLGIGNLGPAASIVSTLLAYAQFIAIYSALEADVSIDSQPLVRTKKTTEARERKKLTAIVKLNVGNAEMLNCFRFLLAPLGLDFNLGNDGPVKGAHVSWYGVEGFDESAGPLHGGPDAIVRLTSDGAGPVTDAVTGDDGKVRVTVEGRPQRQQISNDATEVPKSAKVRLQVALKGADLFGDLQEAAGTAASGLVGLATVPLSILMRAQWASVGHYRFSVTDWRDGPAQWTGTITYTRVTKWNRSSSGKGGSSQQDYNDTLRMDVEVTGMADLPSVFGNSAAVMEARARAMHTEVNDRSGVKLVMCNRVVRQSTYSQVDNGEGSGAGTARVSLGISADGQYSVSVHPEVIITYRSTYRAVQNNVDGRKQCGITTTTSSSSSSGTEPATVDIQGDGMVDPSKPDRLTGKTEEKEGDTTKTITWDLQRR
jgi:hypothetical protein